MTSYLRYLFSAPTQAENSTDNVNTAAIKGEYVYNIDKYYDSARLEIDDHNTSLILVIDVSIANPNNAISLFNFICDELEKNETKTIECDGDSYCFFRQPFNIATINNKEDTVITSTSYNRCSTIFSVRVKKDNLIKELRNMISKITHRESV